ncbi:MAG TPA: uracil-DNA glycosylase [Deltaproteobacteria bacterium]|nr:uracil-DNA glycosylase [Deltaproteobacteria bacterium]
MNCFTCSHFFITHDPHEPYGCRAMGFKSRQFPSDVAESCSGMQCQMYAPKIKRQHGHE